MGSEKRLFEAGRSIDEEDLAVVCCMSASGLAMGSLLLGAPNVTALCLIAAAAGLGFAVWETADMCRVRTNQSSAAKRSGRLSRASTRFSAAVLERDLLIGASMAFIGGFVDAAGFMALGGLFTSHVTGNFVLIGEQLAIGTDNVVAKLAALPAFIIAVGGARLLALAMERRNVGPLRPLMLLEAMLLSAFLLSGTVLSPLRLPDSLAAIFVGIFAVAAMGVQNAIGRLAIAHLATTTVMTVNVAQATIDGLDILLGASADQVRSAKGRLRRMAPAIGSFAVGALAGAFGFALFAFACVSVPIGLLLALFSRETLATRKAKALGSDP